MLVYTCISNLVPNTLAAYFISMYTKDFTVILWNFLHMREQIAPGHFSSQKKGLGPRLTITLNPVQWNQNNVHIVTSTYREVLLQSIIEGRFPIMALLEVLLYTILMDKYRIAAMAQRCLWF